MRPLTTFSDLGRRRDPYKPQPPASAGMKSVWSLVTRQSRPITHRSPAEYLRRFGSILRRISRSQAVTTGQIKLLRRTQPTRFSEKPQRSRTEGRTWGPLALEPVGFRSWVWLGWSCGLGFDHSFAGGRCHPAATTRSSRRWPSMWDHRRSWSLVLETWP